VGGAPRKTILSGNAVTFLAAAVLYSWPSARLKGFAFTLGLTDGRLDTVVVFLVTWPLLYLAGNSEDAGKAGIYNGRGPRSRQVARRGGGPADRGRGLLDGTGGKREMWADTTGNPND